MMTNQDLLRIAMSQSAEDLGCRPDDFLSDKNVIVPFKLGDNAKKYYSLPIGCNFVSYGNNIVASANGILPSGHPNFITASNSISIIVSRIRICIGLTMNYPLKDMGFVLWQSIIFRIFAL